jgi:hypothetical protein
MLNASWCLMIYLCFVVLAVCFCPSLVWDSTVTCSFSSVVWLRFLVSWGLGVPRLLLPYSAAALACMLGVVVGGWPSPVFWLCLRCSTVLWVLGCVAGVVLVASSLLIQVRVLHGCSSIIGGGDYGGLTKSPAHPKPLMLAPFCLSRSSSFLFLGLSELGHVI